MKSIVVCGVELTLAEIGKMWKALIQNLEDHTIQENLRQIAGRNGKFCALLCEETLTQDYHNSTKEYVLDFLIETHPNLPPDEICNLAASMFENKGGDIREKATRVLLRYLPNGGAYRELLHNFKRIPEEQLQNTTFFALIDNAPTSALAATVLQLPVHLNMALRGLRIAKGNSRIDWSHEPLLYVREELLKQGRRTAELLKQLEPPAPPKHSKAKGKPRAKVNGKTKKGDKQ